MPSYQIKQSSTAYPLVFLLVSSTDHVTPVTGISPTVTISKSGGSFASPSGAVSEIANGWYKVAGNATDSATLGPIVLHATGTGADPTDALYEVVAVDPQSTAFGLSLAKTTNITGFNDIAATAIVSSGAITTSGGAVSTVTTTGTATTVTNPVTISVGTGTGQINLSSGKVPATIAAGDLAANSLTASALATDAVTEIATGVLSTSVPGSFAAGTVGAIIGGQPIGVFTSGLAQGGTTSSITLAADAPSLTIPTNGGNFWITVDNGTGQGQSAPILTINNTSKVATISGTWLAPVSGDHYYIVYDAYDRVDIGSWLGAAPSALQSGRVDAYLGANAGLVWDEAQSTHTTAGTFGKYVDTTISSRLAPTTSGRTLDVSAGGEAGIDWANVGSPTTTVGLTGTTISTSQVVASVAGAVGSVTGAVGSVTGNVGGNVVGSVASVTSKTGYSLASTGLDAISVTAPTTVAATFPEMVVQTWRRFFAKATKTSTQLKTYGDNGTSVYTTQTVSDDGTTETQGAAS